MATFEEQCDLVSRMFIESRDRNSSDPSIVAIFDRLDMAGPLAAAVVAQDVSIVSNRPKQWIAETYLALLKIAPTEANSANVLTKSLGESIIGGSEKIEPTSAIESSDQKVENTPNYESAIDAEQQEEMEEILKLYNRGDATEALDRAKTQLAKLRNLENVDLYAAYNIAYVFHDDELRTPDTEQFCREMFEFVSTFPHEVGGAAANTFAFSYLIPEGNIEQAEALLRRTISWDLGFQSSNALSNLGQIIFRQKKFFKAEAIFTFIRMSGFGGIRPEANYWLGRIYDLTNRHEQAKRVWTEVSLVPSDTYHELALECLDGKIPEIEFIDSGSDFEFEITGYPVNKSTASSIPDFEDAKLYVKEYFPGIQFDTPPRSRLDGNLIDAAKFISYLDSANFNAVTLHSNSWSELLDFYRFFDALDEPAVRFAVELATRSMNLGCWQDAAVIARSHFMLGNLDLSIACWRLQHALVVKNDYVNQLAESKYPVISIYLHLTRALQKDLATELAETSEIADNEIIAFLNGYVQEKGGSLNNALMTISKHSDPDIPFTELAKAVVMIRDQDWKEVRGYLWELDSKRLEMGDESNTGLEVENFRLRCVLGKCDHEFAPEIKWVSGIDLISMSLVAAYYSRWNEFIYYLAEAAKCSNEHGMFCENVFNSIAEEKIVQDAASNPETPEVILEYISKSNLITALVNLARNPSAKNLISALDQNFVTLAMGTASSQSLSELAKSDKLEILLLVASAPNVSPLTLYELAKNESQELLQVIFKSPNCDKNLISEVLDKVSNDLAWEIASAPECSSEILNRLATHESEMVRRAVGRHAHTPDEAMMVLASDSSWTVRDAVKTNENASDNARALALLME